MTNFDFNVNFNSKKLTSRLQFLEEKELSLLWLNGSIWIGPM